VATISFLDIGCGPGETEGLLRGAGLEGVHGAYIIWFTRESPLLQRIKGALECVPLGAQYVVSALRS
jgi:hypothetical protein